eukprot:16415-Heterococcus_DN1.PRE.1
MLLSLLVVALNRQQQPGHHYMILAEHGTPAMVSACERCKQRSLPILFALHSCTVAGSRRPARATELQIIAAHKRTAPIDAFSSSPSLLSSVNEDANHFESDVVSQHRSRSMPTTLLINVRNEDYCDLTRQDNLVVSPRSMGRGDDSLSPGLSVSSREEQLSSSRKSRRRETGASKHSFSQSPRQRAGLQQQQQQQQQHSSASSANTLATVVLLRCCCGPNECNALFHNRFNGVASFFLLLSCMSSTSRGRGTFRSPTKKISTAFRHSASPSSPFIDVEAGEHDSDDSLSPDRKAPQRKLRSPFKTRAKSPLPSKLANRGHEKEESIEDFLQLLAINAKSKEESSGSHSSYAAKKLKALIGVKSVDRSRSKSRKQSLQSAIYNIQHADATSRSSSAAKSSDWETIEDPEAQSLLLQQPPASVRVTAKALGSPPPPLS